MAQKPKHDDQAKVFRKAARELGCEDNEERFQEALRTIAKARLKPRFGSKEKAERLTVSRSANYIWRSRL